MGESLKDRLRGLESERRIQHLVGSLRRLICVVFGVRIRYIGSEVPLFAILVRQHETFRTFDPTYLT